MVSTPLIGIVGPTASGKSALGMMIAERYGGEIIAADSRTIYRGMDIGTAKPTQTDQAVVPHHLLDLVDPGERYSAAEFKLTATQVIEAIEGRGHLPLIVGGTGLYVYSVMYDYRFPAGARTNERARLEILPTAQLADMLRVQDPEAAMMVDLKNPRRIIRALETIGQPRQKAPRLKSNFLLIGLRPSPEQLNKQIARRTKAMFQMGLVDEVTRLVQRYGAENEAFRSPGYVEIINFLAGVVSREEAEELINLHTRQLVRRQLTWFKRNPQIHWYETIESAREEIGRFLAK